MTKDLIPRAAVESAAIEDLRSVMYRTGPMTPEDYMEAAEDMQNAARQSDVSAYGCAICADSGHTAESCHHNILLAARKWAAATSVHVCYHCGFVATTDEEAREHFGSSDEEEAACRALPPDEEVKISDDALAVIEATDQSWHEMKAEVGRLLGALDRIQTVLVDVGNGKYQELQQAMEDIDTETTAALHPEQGQRP